MTKNHDGVGRLSSVKDAAKACSATRSLFDPSAAELPHDVLSMPGKLLRPNEHGFINEFEDAVRIAERYSQSNENIYKEMVT